MSETVKKPWYKKLAFSVAEIFNQTPQQVEAKVTLREAAGVTIDDDESDWRPLSGDSKRDLSPITQKRMREMAFYLWESNVLANRLIELPLAFILAEGVKLSHKDPEAQKTLNKFWKHPINNMDIKLTKKVREMGLYGEQCYPAFVNEINGAVQLGYLDPAEIADVIMDPSNKEQPIGVITCKDRKGNYKKFKVIINGPEDLFTERTQEIRKTFTDGECFYFTVNDVSNGKRGRSDLLASADWLDGYDEFLFNELDRVKELRSFIWDVTLKGATEEDVKKRAKEIAPPGPNSVRVHNDNEEWKAETPTINSTDTSNTGRLFRNHIMGGNTIPEHWFGGGGDVNRAVGAEMGEPTFKIFTMRQTMVRYMLTMMGIYVLRQKKLAETKTEPELDDPLLEFDVIFPEMTSKDISKYAAAIQQVVVACAMAIEKNLMSDATAVKIISSIAGRLGVEFDAETELKDVQDARAKAVDDQNFTTPPLDQAA